MQKLWINYKESFSGLPRNVWLLSVAQLINRSGSMVLLFSTLFFTRDLHFSKEEAGFIMGFYGIGSVAGSYFGGWLTDRFNYKSIMLFALLSSGLVLFALLFITNAVGLCGVLFLYALLADSFRPANSKAIAQYSSAENRTRSVSLLRLAINLGFTIGPAIGGFIAMLLGYRWLFVIDAVTGFGAAAMLYFFLPAQAKSSAKVLFQKKEFETKSAYKDVVFIFFILIVAVYATVFFQLFASVPVYFKEALQFSESKIGLLLALNGFIVFLLEMPLVSYFEKKKNIFGMIIIGALFLPVSFLILMVSGSNLAGIIVYTILITLSEIFAMPFMMNFALSRPAEERQGQYSALYSIAYGIANILAPSAALFIAGNFGFKPMFWSIIGAGILVVTGFWIIQTKTKKETINSAISG